MCEDQNTAIIISKAKGAINQLDAASKSAKNLTSIPNIIAKMSRKQLVSLFAFSIGGIFGIGLEIGIGNPTKFPIPIFSGMAGAAAGSILTKRSIEEKISIIDEKILITVEQMSLIKEKESLSQETRTKILQSYEKRLEEMLETSKQLSSSELYLMKPKAK